MPTVEKTKTHGRQKERMTRKGFDLPEKVHLEVHTACQNKISIAQIRMRVNKKSTSLDVLSL